MLDLGNHQQIKALELSKPSQLPRGDGWAEVELRVRPKGQSVVSVSPSSFNCWKAEDLLKLFQRRSRVFKAGIKAMGNVKKNVK